MGYTKVVQPASRLHDIIDVVIRPVPKLVHHNIAAFDATNVMFNLNPFARNFSIVLFIGLTQTLMARLFLGLPNGDSRGSKPLKSRILPYRAGASH